MSDSINNSKDSIESITVSSTIMGNLFSLTQRRIRQLAEEGIIEKASRGKYVLYPSIQKYIAYVKTAYESKDEPDRDIDYEDERALHERIKREIAEINLAKIKGEVHESKDVEAVMNNMLANFRARMIGVPAKVAPMLIARDNIAVIQSYIEKEILEALEELSEYDPEIFLSDEYIAIDDYDEEEVMESNEEEKTED